MIAIQQSNIINQNRRYMSLGGYGAIPLADVSTTSSEAGEGNNNINNGNGGGGGGGGGSRNGDRRGFAHPTSFPNPQSPQRLHLAISALLGLALAALLICVLYIFEPTSSLKKKEYIPVDMLSWMDTTANPCTDFYRYACGNFISKTHLKGDQVEWSPSWDEVEKRITTILRKKLANDPGKAGTFYRACMDEKTINRLGASPLKPYIDMIEKIDSHDSLIKVIATMHSVNVPVFFDWEVMADPIEPTRYVFGIIDGGTTLPEAKYYTDNSATMQHHRQVFLQVVTKVLNLIKSVSNIDDELLTSASDDVLKVETAIAKVTLPNYKLRGAPAVHFTLDDLTTLSPSLDFPLLFHYMHADFLGKTRAEIVCKDLDYMRGVSDIINSTMTMTSIKNYLKFRAAYVMGSDLSDDFLEIGLMLGKELTGVEERVPRHQKCFDSTKSNMPDELAKIYVSDHFGKSTRNEITDMLRQLRTSFQQDLLAVSWMSEATRQKALQKLHNMFFAVGHGKWQDYTFSVSSNTFLENTNNAKIWGVVQALKRIEKPVDRERWGSTDPTQSDAFYGRQVNGLFVPVGVLQSPFFSPQSPIPRNYGSLGAVMGHEMTHGFDDVGRRFDMNAKEVNWWTSEDVAHFKARAACIASYYGDFTVLGQHVNGNMTLPEDIADMGGVKISFRAMERLFESKHERLTPDDQKLFFLSWGQTWCSIRREETEKMALLTDEHAPDRFRAVGPLAQFPTFAAVFQCPVGTEMNPKHRCELW